MFTQELTLQELDGITLNCTDLLCEPCEDNPLCRDECDQFKETYKLVKDYYSLASSVGASVTSRRVFSSDRFGSNKDSTIESLLRGLVLPVVFLIHGCDPVSVKCVEPCAAVELKIYRLVRYLKGVLLKSSKSSTLQRREFVTL